MGSHDDLDFLAANETDLDALGEALSHAFGFPREDANSWFLRAGIDNVRTLKRGGRVRGGLIEVPMGQWFGGRSVSTMGVAGVGVVPEERGRGVAAYLVNAMLREARGRGFALSTLYPATVALYRRAGYERAGARFSITIDPRMFEVARVPEVSIAEVSGTPPAVMSLYDAVARESPGFLDRPPYIWERVSNRRGMVTKTFTASHGGVLEGYVALAHASTGDSTAVTVTDLAAKTSRAAQAILRLLIEYRSLAKSVQWHGGAADVFTNLLPERHAKTMLADCFMVRVIDVVRALSQRGYPYGASGAVELEVNDTSLPENSGIYTLALEGGKAAVLNEGRPSAPRAVITERGLAALYTGNASTHVLASAGWLEASDEARALLDAWFAGPMPTMRDYF